MPVLVNTALWLQYLARGRGVDPLHRVFTQFGLELRSSAASALL